MVIQSIPLKMKINTAFHLFFFISISLFKNRINATEEYTSLFAKSTDPKSINSQPEKLTHFTFYFHDTVSGKSPSAVTVVQPPNNTTNFFGLIRIIDDPLTIGPEISSKLVGRAQWLYAVTSQEEDVALLMNVNFAFIEGKYNGSSITVTGRNPPLHPIREIPVIGGSGVFRFARGYALAKTYSVNFSAGDAIVEYNVFVFHN